MSDTAAATPKHIWIVGVLSLLWNSMGAFDYTMTQTRNAEYLAMFTPEQKAYFESFPFWMEMCWALGIWGSIAGSLLLLLRSRHAFTAFAISLAGLAGSSLWQFGLSGADNIRIFGTTPMIMTVLIWIIAIALFLYTRKQKAAGVLR